MGMICLPILNVGMTGRGESRIVALTIAYTSTQFTFKFKLPSTKSVTIHWGDGNTEAVVGQDSTLITKTSAYSGAGTYYFYLTGDVTEITYIDINSQTFVSGDIGTWSSLVNCVYLNACITGVSGSIAGYSALTLLQYLRLNNTNISGSITGLSALTALTTLYLYSLGGDGVTGDISGFNTMTSLTGIIIRSLVGVDFDSQTAWTLSGATIQFNENSMSSTQVNNMIASLKTCTNCTIHIAGNNAHRTAASNDDLNTLLANGNTITLNDVLGDELYTLLNAANDNPTEAITAFADYSSTIDGGTQVTVGEDISEMLPKDNRPIKAAISSFADYSSTIDGATRVNSSFDLYGFIPQGSETITNGTFDADSDWSKGSGWSIGSGVASCDGTNGTSLSQTSVWTVGKYYLLTFDITAYTSGSVQIFSGTGADGSSAKSAVGSYSMVIRPNTADIYCYSNSFNGSLDNVSVKELQVVGSDLVTNGGFATDTDWTKEGTISISGGTLNFNGETSGARAYQNSVLSSNGWVILKFTISGYSAGNVRVEFGNTSSYFSANGTYTVLLYATDGNLDIRCGTTTTTLSVDNISVHKLTLPIHIEESTNYSINAIGNNYQYLIPIDENDFCIPVDYAAESITDQVIATTCLNGDFSKTDVWNLGTGVTISGGTCNFTGGTGSTNQSNMFTEGKYYLLEYEITAYTSGSIRMYSGNIADGSNAYSSTGVKKDIIRATGNNLHFWAAAFTGSIDNASITELQVLGDDLVTNGDFTTDTDWSKGVGWSIAAGVASCDGSQVAASNIFQNESFDQGDAVLYKLTISNYSAGSLYVKAGNTNLSSPMTANGTYIVLLIIDSDSYDYITIEGNSTFVGDVDNVSVHKLTATKEILDSTNYEGTHYVLPEVGDDLDSFIIPVDYAAESIVDQKITGEYNAATGWTEQYNGVIQSVSTPVNTGGYALKIDSMEAPAQAANASIDLEAAPFSIIDDDIVRIELYSRHLGFGSNWRIALSTSPAALTHTIKDLENTNTTYTKYTFYWLHDDEHRYLTCRESGANDGGLFIDAISIKKVTFT